MSRFAVAKGANPITFLGLSGMGDLVATCTSGLSRNYQLGSNLGQGMSLQEAKDKVGQQIVAQQGGQGMRGRGAGGQGMRGRGPRDEGMRGRGPGQEGMRGRGPGGEGMRGRGPGEEGMRGRGEER